MRRWIASWAVLCVLVLPLGAAGQAQRGADGLLVVPPLARVYDPEGYLAPADRAMLENKLAAFEAAHGSQIAILLVASTKPEPIEDFAHRVGEAWKIGRRGIGDGVLIVVAIQDRTARIDVARRLEGAIPDAVAYRLIREKMGPRFRAKDYAGGLVATLDAMFALITAERLPGGAGESQSTGGGAPSSASGEEAIRSLIPFLIGGMLFGAVLRRLLGVLGTFLAAGGAAAIVAYLFSSYVLAAVVGLLVFVLVSFGGPMLAATQVLGGRGGGFLPGGMGRGGGGFSSGGGGDFSGGGASGNW